MHIGDVYGLAKSRERLAFLCILAALLEFACLIAIAQNFPQRRRAAKKSEKPDKNR